MADETPEQNRIIHDRAIVSRSVAEMLAWKRGKQAEQRRQAHIDQLKKLCGVS